MPTSKLKILASVTMLSAGLAMQASGALAFDASKIIQGNTPSTKVFEFFFNFRKDGKSEEAFEVLKYAAEHGHSAAQWKLARSYQTGDGVDQDPMLAFNIFQKIAAQYPSAQPNTPDWQFSADALVALGDYYKNGIAGTPVQPDSAKAQMMYTTAAMVFRHPVAQFELGRMQLSNNKGFGQPTLALRNLSLAYQKGHVGAEALLGYVIFEGEYIKKNTLRGLVMLGNAKRRAGLRDLEWITPLHDEAFALAAPEERIQANIMLDPTQSKTQ